METPSIQETRGRTPLGPPTRDAGGRAARLAARTARATLSLGDVPSDEAPHGRVTTSNPLDTLSVAHRPHTPSKGTSPRRRVGLAVQGRLSFPTSGTANVRNRADQAQRVCSRQPKAAPPASPPAPAGGRQRRPRDASRTRAEPTHRAQPHLGERASAGAIQNAPSKSPLGSHGPALREFHPS